ncbi:Inactive beta-amylase 4 chloroplastic [Bienertia sinuspersici]
MIQVGLRSLLQTVAKKRAVSLTGRNCTERFDKAGLQQIQDNCHNQGADSLRSFTYFRMGGNIFQADNWNNFMRFLRSMNAEQ